jgi:hypothetical protein
MELRETLRPLIDLLGRMEEHRQRKASRLPKLRVFESIRPRPDV